MKINYIWLMEISEVYKFIPKSFKCGQNDITVKVQVYVQNEDGSYTYGDFCDVKNEIRIATRIILNDTKEDIELTKNQILNSFYHELVHCFDFYYDNSYSEAHAQSMANLMLEYENTRTY